MAEPNGSAGARPWAVVLPGLLLAAPALLAAWWWHLAAFGALLAALAIGVWQWQGYRGYLAWRRAPHTRPPELPPPFDGLATRGYRAALRARRRRRALLTQLRRYRAFAASLPDALVVIDRNDVIEWFSPLAETYLGLTHRDLGKLLPALLRHRDVLALLEGRGGERIAEVQIAPYERALELRISPLDDQHRLFIARDTTQVQRLLTMRQDFVANVSHELRTPLTVIVGYLEQMESPDLDAATLRTLAQRSTQPALRMKNLVDDLLLLTRLESSNLPSPLELEAVDLNDLLRAVLSEIHEVDRNAHRFVLDVDATAAPVGMERELYSALSNLVMNAVRYSPAGSEVRVSWQTAADTREEADGALVGVCSVQDQGIGIAAEHVSRITERFYRVDLGRSRHTGGTGLGLAIVKHVLRRHGSELRIASTPGTGSTFSFELSGEHIRRVAVAPDHASRTAITTAP